MRYSRLAQVVCLAGVMALAWGCSKATSDTQLATNIKAQMFSDPQTKDASVQVSVKDGVATLTGTTPTDASHLEAYKIATNTPGITKVNDEIGVTSPDQAAQATPPAASAPAPPPVEQPARQPERRERRSTHETHRPVAAAQQQSAPPASTSDQSASQAPPSPAPDQSQSAPAPPPPPPPPQPVDINFPAGSVIHVQTVDTIDSATAQQGQEYQATLAQPLISDGQVIVPAGAKIAIRIAAVQDAGHYKGRNELQLQLARLTFQGHKYALDSSTYTLNGSSRGKNTAEKVGGLAALGAIVGAIAGGGKGAAIGAGAGAGGGAVYQGATKAKPLRIPSETKLDFQLNQPLNISYLPPGGSQ